MRAPALAESVGEVGDGSWFFNGPRVQTPSGGLHLYLSVSPGITIPSSAGRLAPWVDVRSEGAYVVGPWSRTEASAKSKAGDYEPIFGWAADLRPVDDAFRILDVQVSPYPLPGWLLELLLPHQGRTSQRDSWSSLERRVATASPPRRAYVDAAIRGEVDRVRKAPVGQRNDALNRAAHALGTLIDSHGLDEETITAVLVPVGLDAGLLDAEVRRTIKSGVRAGQSHPRGAA